MTDHAAEAARSAAAILAPDLGRNLPVEVEAALAARSGDQRPDRYFDAISWGTLIVTIATFAWTVYNDQRNRTREHKPEPSTAVQEPEEESLARAVRNKLRERDEVLPTGTERITQVVVTEVIRQAKEPGS